MKSAVDPLERFVGLSAALTGFERVDLYGTGLASALLGTVESVVGEATTALLLGAWASIDERFRGEPAVMDEAIRAEILASPRLGPVARNVIQLWYLGSWIEMPQGWRQEYGTSPLDTTRVVSAAAYQQSLVFDVMRAHPPGAKQPGYGSWALPPETAVNGAEGREAEEVAR